MARRTDSMEQKAGNNSSPSQEINCLLYNSLRPVQEFAIRLYIELDESDHFILILSLLLHLGILFCLELYMRSHALHRIIAHLMRRG